MIAAAPPLLSEKRIASHSGTLIAYVLDTWQIYSMVDSITLIV